MDWHELRARMLGPKPALSARVYALGKPPTEVALPDDGPGWALAALDPARYTGLAGAEGTVTGAAREAGRTCVVADVVGLRGRGTVRVWVDEATGAIVRMERPPDPTPLLVIEGLAGG